MENTLPNQLLELAATVLTGFALGFVYDFLRVLRTLAEKRLVSATADLLFCVLAAFALFALGMGPGGGELRLYMPVLAAGGAGVYLFFFGRCARAVMRDFLRFAGKILRFFLVPGRFVLRFAKNISFFLKNLFSSAQKWFTIIFKNKAGKVAQKPKPGSLIVEETAYEAQKIQYFHKDRGCRAHRVRDRESDRHKG